MFFPNLMWTSDPVLSKGNTALGTSSQNSESGSYTRKPESCWPPSPSQSNKTPCDSEAAAFTDSWADEFVRGSKGAEDRVARSATTGGFLERAMASRCSPRAAWLARNSWFSRRSEAISVRCFSLSARSFAFSAFNACKASSTSAGGSETLAERAAFSCASSLACNARTWFSSFACSLCSARSMRYWRRQARLRTADCKRTAASRDRLSASMATRRRWKACIRVAQRSCRRMANSRFARTARRWA
mmetsp:Transcript_90469/g.255385  ORF Transcript_90469/g.255385 Transcript_90469/m.255385 type:complete len:245 (+) Transcript_90469:951-1685(+)